MFVSAAGIAVCAVGMYAVIKMDVFGVVPLDTTNNQESSEEKEDKNEKQNDSEGKIKLDGPNFPGNGGPSVIRIQGQEDGLQQVPTGNSSIPYFPTTIKLPSNIHPNLKPGDEVPTSSDDNDQEEYQLLGLGIRAVSFLKIQVYVVGLYIAKSDISELQKLLMRIAINPPTTTMDEEKTAGSLVTDSATSLVPGERQQLKDLLLDPVRGEEAWNAILKTGTGKVTTEEKNGGIRTALRIVPTRNTDFMHLRDGWVRGITARASAAAQSQQTTTGTATEFQDESFGTALNDFKAVFGGSHRKSVPKGQALLLLRNARGVFDALYQPDPAQPLRWMGRVDDERVSRLVWLNYLAGKNVASEGARQSVVEGVIGVVERPVGTVVQKVV